MSQAMWELGQKIADAIGSDIHAFDVASGELVLHGETTAIPRILTYLRDNGDLLFSQLMDVCGVDYLEREERFDVVYNLLSLKKNHRIRVKVRVSEGVPVPSVTSVFSSAGWWERETCDMYGIPFSDHPDLRRILTDYGFEGYPLRKDFPLSGYVEVRYDEDQKRVIYEPVNLPQAYRNFDNESPWDAMEYAAAGVLPGDEKVLKEAV